MKIEVEIEHERILIEALIDDLRFNHEEVERLSQIEQPRDNQLEDLKYCKDVMEACKVLLSYYLTYDVYNEIVESGRYMNRHRESTVDATATETDLGYPRS